MFRTKIAILSVTISGVVVFVFGLFFLNIIYSVGVDRIDRELLALGETQLHGQRPRQYWQDFGQSLRAIYGQSRFKDLIVEVTDAEHKTLYRTNGWPPEISTALFPNFDYQMAADRRPHAKPPPRIADNLHRGPPQHAPQPGPIHIKEPFFQTRHTPSGKWRMGIMGNQQITILVGMNLAILDEDARKYQRAFQIAFPLTLLLLAGGGYFIAHRAIKPVALITATAKKITARGLDQRIPEISADKELLQLVKVINKMLDRLEKSFEQAVRFSADAAHELQTPLTILQGLLDDAVQHTESGSDDQRRHSSLLEEVQHLKSIVWKLLLLARADSGQMLLHSKPVDISAMISSAIEDAEVMGPKLKIEQEIKPGIMVAADPDLLKLVIQNLTNNAVKYNRKDGLIRFNLAAQNSHALFKVSNSGAAIPYQDHHRIFDRFYRVDKSRGNRKSGTGLGLSLSREIARAHKGDLRLESSQGNLNTFVLSIPCSP